MHPCLPLLAPTLCAARFLRSTGVTLLHHYYKPSRHRLVCYRRPGCAGYTVAPAPSISRWDQDGFSSCSACPGHRAAPNHPAGVTRRFGQIATHHAAFARPKKARPPDLLISRPPLGSLALRPGDSLTILFDGFVDRLHPLRFLHGCDPSYRVSDSYPGGALSH